MQLDPLLHLLLCLGPGLVVVVVALAAAPAVAEVAGRGGVATVLLYMRQGGGAVLVNNSPTMAFRIYCPKFTAQFVQYSISCHCQIPELSTTISCSVSLPY